jgi:hypothetical protein
MVERIREGGERIAGANHGLEARPVDRRDQRINYIVEFSAPAMIFFPEIGSLEATIRG